MPDNTNIEQNAGAAKQQETKTKRDLALERLKTLHPDNEIGRASCRERV